MSTARNRKGKRPGTLDRRWPVEPRTTAGILRWLADAIEGDRPAEALKAAGSLQDYGMVAKFIAPAAVRKHELTTAG